MTPLPLLREWAAIEVFHPGRTRRPTGLQHALASWSHESAF